MKKYKGGTQNEICKFKKRTNDRFNNKTKGILLGSFFAFLFASILVLPTFQPSASANNQESTIQFENKTIAEDGTITQINNIDSL